MSYQIKLEVFEGPFDLLLNLISRHTVSVYDVPLATITEEYLSYLGEMRQLDLEIATDFLLVAATLLEIKSAGLLPKPVVIEEDETLTAYDQRQLLIGRLIEYQKYKNAGLALGSREKAESLFFSRKAALDPEFDQLLPDFLAGIDLTGFGEIITKLLQRERVRLIDSNHIASIKISLETKIDEVMEQLRRVKLIRFAELTQGADRADIVATFLALLELYKQGRVELRQPVTFGEIEIVKSRIN